MILAWASSFNARAVSNARPASVSRLTARYKNSRHMLCPQKKRKNHKICPTKMQMSTTRYMYVRKNAKINVRHKIHCIFSRTYLDLVADTTGPSRTRALL